MLTEMDPKLHSAQLQLVSGGMAAGAVISNKSLTSPSSLIQLPDFPASLFPGKREWVRPSLLEAKTLFHHQAPLCDWTGQDLALHASSIFSSHSLSP